MADPTSWDLLDEDCSVITDWVDNDNGSGVSSVSPSGQFKMDSGNLTSAYHRAARYRTISTPPDTFTFEIKVYHDSLGTRADADYTRFYYMRADELVGIFFATDGLFLRDSVGFNEVGTNLVKYNSSAEWQTWRFLVTFTGVAGDATCDVYLNDSTHDWEKVGTSISCSKAQSSTNGKCYIAQDGQTHTYRISHIDYIKIATGLYPATTYLGYFSGYVFEQNNPVSRKLYLHNRTTGDLVTTITASGNGYYYLETALSGSHYIVCLDDEAGEEYNDLIIGSVFPTEIT
jgi:hypothetical protein